MATVLVLGESNLSVLAEENNGDAGGENNSMNPADSSGKNPAKDAEPKTGNASHVEIYATVTMIARLAYLLLYFSDEERGMSEEEKREIVSSMIRWAKRGNRFERYIILIPIFILLFYYHSIGKRVCVEYKGRIINIKILIREHKNSF